MNTPNNSLFTAAQIARLPGIAGQSAGDDKVPPGAFTSARIAACLGISPQAVRKALSDTPATGLRMIRGGEAATWSVDRLPEPLRKRLDEEAQRHNYRDAAAMLAEPPKQWDPPLPLEKVAEAQIESARKLREVLRPW